MSSIVPTIEDLLKESSDKATTKAQRIGTIVGQLLGSMYVDLLEKGIPHADIVYMISENVYRIATSLMTCPNDKLSTESVISSQLQRMLEEHEFANDTKPN